MQLQLKQTELESAVREYIVNMGISRPVGKVKFTATRGNEGILTEVELDDLNATAPVVTLVEDAPDQEQIPDPVKVVEPAKTEKKAGKETGSKKAESEPAAEKSATIDPGKSLFGG
jgi:hypothetical protein